MKQVIQSYKNGKIVVADVPEPLGKAGGLLVRTVASLISPGTERLMIEMGRKSLLGKARARPDLVRQAWAKARKEGFVSVFQEALNRLDEPVPLGYSAAGVVVEVGAGVVGFNPGDPVAVAGAGWASHAEVIWAPENLCVPLPPGMAFETAAFGMLGAIALHGVRRLGLSLGETGVVVGLGLLGLLSVQLLAAQGCRVVGVDLDREKGRLAQKLGAEAALVPGEDEVAEAVANLTGGQGADGVLITAGGQDPAPLRLAEEVARERSRLVLVGAAEISLTRKSFWDKELEFTVSKAAGPGSLDLRYESQGWGYPLSLVRWTERRNLEAFLDLAARGLVRVEPLISHRFQIAEALQAYDLILQGREPAIGVLLQYPAGEAVAARPEAPARFFVKAPKTVAATGTRTTVGLIGGGNFAKNVLLPALAKVSGLRLEGVATTTGTTAHHLARKFGFAYAATDYRELLADAAIGSVIITTRHDLHGPMVLEALAAGKQVFVEKPLCLTAAELEQIGAAYDGSRLLMVGFNRRFAPLAVKVKAFLRGRTTPLVMSYRVNAGYLPEDHWVHDPRMGGGRLVGEVCHFIDFLQFLTDSEPVRVSAASISGACGRYRPDDNLEVTLTFRDGSLGTIIYTAKGCKTFSRERLEVFGEDSVAVLEDFRRAVLARGRRRQKLSKFAADLGYRGELEFFLRSELEVSRNQKLFRSYAVSTLATLQAQEALRSGAAAPISF
jgi:predicted dehydrogenase/threonine dehydrogenase-like Zn-dependent dehydrogenase